MLRRLAIAACSIGISCGAVEALGDQKEVDAAMTDLLLCKLETGDKERLACFDKVAATASGILGKALAAALPSPSVHLSPGDYKPTHIEDMRASPSKYMGKAVEVSGLRCFAADTSDFRCVHNGFAAVAVFSEEFEPLSANKFLAEKCNSIRSLTSSTCTFNIRFVVADVVSDVLSGYTQRIIFKAARVTAFTPQRRNSR